MVFVPDENIKHIVSAACRPGVFQTALFKGFPNIPTFPPPLWDTRRAQIRQQRHQPLKTLRVGMKCNDPERYVCVCMYVYVYVCVYCMYVYVHVHVYVSVCVCVCVCMCMCRCMCMCMCMCVCVYVCMCVCVCVCERRLGPLCCS